MPPLRLRPALQAAARPSGAAALPGLRRHDARGPLRDQLRRSRTRKLWTWGTATCNAAAKARRALGRDDPAVQGFLVGAAQQVRGRGAGALAGGGKVLAHFLGADPDRGVGARRGPLDGAVGVDDHGATLRDVLHAEDGGGHGGPDLADEGAVGVAQDAELQVLLCGEGLVGRTRVGAEAEDLGVERGEGTEVVAEVAHLLRAAAREGQREEAEDEGTLAEVVA